MPARDQRPRHVELGLVDGFDVLREILRRRRRVVGVEQNQYSGFLHRTARVFAGVPWRRYLKSHASPSAHVPHEAQHVATLLIGGPAAFFNRPRGFVEVIRAIYARARRAVDIGGSRWC